MQQWRRSTWRVGFAIVVLLISLVLIPWTPRASAIAHTPEAGRITTESFLSSATPTEDATVTTLNKEKLTLDVHQQQHTVENWFWDNAATLLANFLSTLVIVVGALFGLWRWRVDRKDVREKEQQDRQNEQDKRAEERFQSVVTGLASENEGANIGSAILLRTFLQPGYEQFYIQTFDLAVASLRQLRSAPPSEEPEAALPLTTFSQALIVVFKESFPLARRQNKGGPRALDARRIQLDNAYLREADLKQAWLPSASLKHADLRDADLSEVILFKADLSGADLRQANLTKANLGEAVFSTANLGDVKLIEADLRMANLRGANLGGANLSGGKLRHARLQGANLWKANLSGADFSNADLSGTNLRDTNIEECLSAQQASFHAVEGLSQQQVEACKRKGAIFDEDTGGKESTLQTTL